jgi:hypothetical protein
VAYPLFDYADHVVGGLLNKGLSAICGLQGHFKCTECGYMRESPTCPFGEEDPSGKNYGAPARIYRAMTKAPQITVPLFSSQ